MYDPSRKYTLDEYWEVVETSPEQKYEYIDGDVRLMTGGSLSHAQIIANITYALQSVLRHTECNVYSGDGAVKLWDSRIYYPDLSVSCDPRDWTRKKALESPTVVVEVHSPSTERIDRSEKLIAHQQYPTIQEILFVDSRKHYVDHHHRIGVSKWEHSIYTQDEEIIELASIDVSLTVEDVYLKVYLELEE
ncbi:MAG TPA: Uma2 family endonuclease [Dictyobacter sp.]|nr:Uma2 family endonuclease [Dictyobacter sp.]